MKKFITYLTVILVLGGLLTASIIFDWPWCYLPNVAEEPAVEKELKWVDDYTLGNPVLCRFTIQDCNSYDAESDDYLSYVFTFATCPTTEDNTNHVGTLTSFNENYWFLFDYRNLKSGELEKAYAHISVKNILNEDGTRQFGISSEYLDLNYNVLEYGVDHDIIGGNYMYLMEI